MCFLFSVSHFPLASLDRPPHPPLSISVPSFVCKMSLSLNSHSVCPSLSLPLSLLSVFCHFIFIFFTSLFVSLIPLFIFHYSFFFILSLRSLYISLFFVFSIFILLCFSSSYPPPPFYIFLFSFPLSILFCLFPFFPQVII